MPQVLTANKEPRSYEESPAYRPDWRRRQAQSYLDCSDAAERSAGEKVFSFPEEETDEIILRYYLYRKSGSHLKDPDIHYASECYDKNAIHGASSLIRTMTVAGLSTEEVARQTGISAPRVQVYKDLFFDVDRYMQGKTKEENQVFYTMCIRNFGSEFAATDAVTKKEQWMMHAGFSVPWDISRDLVFSNIDEKGSNIGNNRNIMMGAIMSKAAEYGMMNLVTQVIARPADFEKAAMGASSGMIVEGAGAGMNDHLQEMFHKMGKYTELREELESLSDSARSVLDSRGSRSATVIDISDSDFRKQKVLAQESFASSGKPQKKSVHGNLTNVIYLKSMSKK